MFHNKASFEGEELLAPRPTPKMYHPLSAVRDCLFNVFALTPHIGGRSSIRNPRTHHTVVTGTHLEELGVDGRITLKWTHLSRSNVQPPHINTNLRHISSLSSVFRGKQWVICYRLLVSFWTIKNLAELADGPTLYASCQGQQ